MGARNNYQHDQPERQIQTKKNVIDNMHRRQSNEAAKENYDDRYYDKRQQHSECKHNPVYKSQKDELELERRNHDQSRERLFYRKPSSDDYNRSFSRLQERNENLSHASGRIIPPPPRNQSRVGSLQYNGQSSTIRLASSGHSIPVSRRELLVSERELKKCPSISEKCSNNEFSARGKFTNKHSIN